MDLRVVIGSYLTILWCPSIDFFVRTTNLTIAERLISIFFYIKAILFWQFERIFYKKSDVIQMSEKADLLSSNKNAGRCLIVSDHVRKVSYCVKLCLMVSGSYQMVSGRCKMVLEKCWVVLDRCHMESRRCPMVPGRCQEVPRVYFERLLSRPEYILKDSSRAQSIF